MRQRRARPSGDAAAVTQAFLCACRFQHRTVAALLLDRCIELDPALGERVEKWRGRSGFIDYLVEHPQKYGSPWQTVVSPWQTVVMSELLTAIDEDNLQEFTRWLQGEPDLLGESHVALQVELIEHAVLKDREPFITRLLEFAPALSYEAPSFVRAGVRSGIWEGASHSSVDPDLAFTGRPLPRGRRWELLASEGMV